MRADEIFVLLLLVVCVAAIVAMNLHSRRQAPPAEADATAEPALEQEAESEAEPEADARASARRSRRPNPARRR